MKKFLFTVLFTVLFAGWLNLCSAADKLAVAEPKGSGVTKEELSLLWNMLEANAGGSRYELITRAALKSMLTEIGLTESSGLVNLSSAQKARMGELKTVKYILVANLNKAGTRYTLSLMVLDASTGEINPRQRCSETANSLAELSDKLKDTLRNLGIGPGIMQYGRSAVLTPIVTVGAPLYLLEEVTVDLENSLLENKVRLQNLKSVTAILKKNGIGSLAEAEPAMYARIGDLLHVDFLIQPTISRFSIRVEKKYIEVTRNTSTRYLGNVSGNLRIISAQTGDLVQSVTFSKRINFSDLDLDTDDWAPEDYGRYLIKAVMPEVCKKAASAITGKK